MNLHDLFDLLLTKREIALCISSAQAQSLRVSLIRKFKDYQNQMEKLGWLTDDLAAAVISLEWNSETQTAKYFLRPPKRKSISYTLIDLSTEESNVSDPPAG